MDNSAPPQGAFIQVAVPGGQLVSLALPPPEMLTTRVPVSTPELRRRAEAVQAKDRATVALWHAAAVAAGGKDNGAPGERPYHPGYYAAFVLDPDGNNIEVVHHGPAQRSADSIRITF
jgi:hypothetical protein